VARPSTDVVIASETSALMAGLTPRRAPLARHDAKPECRAPGSNILSPTVIRQCYEAVALGAGQRHEDDPSLLGLFRVDLGPGGLRLVDETGARPRLACGASAAFSEADSGRFGRRCCAFSVATPGVYFRERYFSEVGPSGNPLASGNDQVDRRPDCAALVPTAEATLRAVVAAGSCGEQQPRRECRPGDNAEAMLPQPRRLSSFRSGLSQGANEPSLASAPRRNGRKAGARKQRIVLSRVVQLNSLDRTGWSPATAVAPRTQGDLASPARYCYEPRRVVQASGEPPSENVWRSGLG
jgi:hypothetical protein